jgi:hypothetical protein
LNAPARTPQQRKADVLGRLDGDVDTWVATADPETGAPYLVPLSFLWDGSTLLIATPATSPTARNLRATGRTRLGLGLSRDVIMIDGSVEELTGGVTDEAGDAFAAKTEFDPRKLAGYRYFRIRPQRLQAWREVNELQGRDLMRDGAWLV